MSRSYRTQKEALIAERHIARHEDGTIVLPRIIERSPKTGDIHPLSKRALANVLKKVPIQYIYGLARIELRARENDIGCPFASYLRDEKAIILYSLPMIWRLKAISREYAKKATKFYAEVSVDGEGAIVSWGHDMLLALWFYHDVLAHELEHHYIEQYKNKNGRLGGRRYNEIVADLHALRFTDDFFKRVRSKRAG